MQHVSLCWGPFWGLFFCLKPIIFLSWNLVLMFLILLWQLLYWKMFSLYPPLCWRLFFCFLFGAHFGVCSSFSSDPFYIFLWNFVVMPLVLIQRLRNFKKFFLACLLPSEVVLGYSFSQYWVTGTFLRYVSLFLQNIPLVLNISHKNFYRWMFLVLLWKLKYWKIFFMPCLFLLVVMLEYFEIN